MKSENARQKKIYEILSIIKLFTLLIYGIIAFSEYMKVYVYDVYSNAYFYDVIPISIFLAIMVVASRLWFGSLYKEQRTKKCIIIQVSEVVLNIVMFTVLIAYAPDVTQYKLLFLLIIITSIIQYGLKWGMIVSLVSSGIVLTIDLISMPNALINENFQNDLIIIGVFILTAWLLGYYEKVEREHREYVTHLALVDGLTEVYNHRHFYESLKKIIDKAKASGAHVSLLFLDIDHFKHYNDLFGHQEGDKVLKRIADILMRSVRSQDFVARYGGEEFAIILVDTSEKAALSVAERIRMEIESTYFEGEEYQPNGKLTVSIGVSTYPEKAQTDTELVNSADDALYRAKFFNKNRVETYITILQELKGDIKEKDFTLITSIKTLISVINAKDKYTYGHTERVVMFSQLLGKGLGLTKENLKILKYGAYLHDIGKIHIPQEILNKKMPLTPDEWDVLKQHPVSGVEIIGPVDSLNNVKPLILHHHERYDGNGYPNGLKGEEIPYLARVMNVIDSFDAMTSNRTYRIRKSFDEAIEELKRCKESQFDPEIVDAFIKNIEENKEKFYSLTSLTN